MRGLLTAGLLAGSFFASQGMAAETYYGYLSPKGTANTFLNRFSAGKNHLVVSRDVPIITPVRLVTLHVPDGKKLYVKEMHAPAGQVIPTQEGEIARLGGFIFVALDPNAIPDGHIHDEGNPTTYIEAVRDEITQADVAHRAPLNLMNEGGSFKMVLDQEFLKEKLNQFTGEQDIEINGQKTRIKERGSKEGRESARAWLAQEYKALGYTVSEQNYGRGANFVAEKSGTDASKVLLVTAHLDSMRNAGADDDGAGIISGLAVAKALQGAQLGMSLRFVGFDEEEIGLVGSRAYVKHLDQAGQLKNIVGVLNLEMTAYDGDGDGEFHVIDCDENTSAQLTDAVMTAVRRENIPLTRVEACTDRSDHASFWDKNVPAIVVSENFFGGDSNPCYHASCDKVNKLHFDYMTNIASAMGQAVADIVQAK